MSKIVGYVGGASCARLLFLGLRRLEHQGFDLAALALGPGEGAVRIMESQGDLSRLEDLMRAESLEGVIGFGLMGWETPGRSAESGAHPHRVGEVVVAYNGVVENYRPLRAALLAAGRVLKSEADGELVAHLIDQALQEGAGSLHQALGQALEQVEGPYGVVAMLSTSPGELAVAQRGMGMVVAEGEGCAFVASEPSALLGHTRRFLFLKDGESALLQAGSMQIFDGVGAVKERSAGHVGWDPITAKKQGHKHFMLKEIHEQPARIIDTLRGRISLERGEVHLPGLGLDRESAQGIEKILFLACGTSYYASQVGKYLLESVARVPVETELANEFRYRNPVLGPNTLAIAISQSGETSDTLESLRLAKKLGARTLSICNVMGSTMACEADGVLYTKAGPEIGVASTKAFTAQLASLAMLTVKFGRLKGTLSQEEAREMLEGLRQVPAQMKSMLKNTSAYEKIAHRFYQVPSMLYTGRGVQFPIACEGALKLKEISYIHAEGYAAGELRHGPIALVDHEMPVVALCPKDRLYERTKANLEEVKSRGGQVIAIGTRGDEHLEQIADVVLHMPEVPEFVQPLISVLAVQLLAYYIADFKGTDVDQPRNLAKSVIGG